jgi:hypothetical protein
LARFVTFPAERFALLVPFFRAARPRFTIFLARDAPVRFRVAIVSCLPSMRRVQVAI